jgi:hypothetical protein
MHQYVRHTYMTVTDLDYCMPVWQDALPKEAISHGFLMHGLLSLSAFHIALTDSSKYKAYVDRAMQHYTLALTLYRPVLNNMDQSNCHALFGFSSLGAIISFALSLASRHTHGAIIQDMHDTFQMLRGIHAVVAIAREWIQFGPIAPLLRVYVPKEYELSPEINHHLSLLEDRARSCGDSNERIEGYLAAIDCGRRAIKNVKFEPDDKTLAFTWPIMVPREYIDALIDRKPMAICILALYGVLLHDLSGYWWAGDRGYRVVEAVRAALDDSWEDALRWPVELLGLNRSYRSESHDLPTLSPTHSSPLKYESMPS